jgi:UDP-glucose 4-epimerase
MKAVVTGASGFLGRALVRSLLDNGCSVTATAFNGSGPFEHPLLKWRNVDLASPDVDWRAMLTGTDVVYHLAWSTVPSEASRRPIDDARVNIIGSLRLIEAARELDSPPRIVFASSGGTVYGALHQIPAAEHHPLRPISAYGVSKRAVESYLEIGDCMPSLSAISLRMGNLYGPGQPLGRVFGVVTHFAHQALAGEPIRIFGDGSVTRDYVYVGDAVEAFVRAGTHGDKGAFNIGTGIGHSLNQIVDLIGTILGRKLPIEYRSARPFDVPVSVLDASRAREVIGWRPRIALEEGVDRTLHAMKVTDRVE